VPVLVAWRRALVFRRPVPVSQASGASAAGGGEVVCDKAVPLAAKVASKIRARRIFAGMSPM
jgi:hypothetical protein